MSQCESHLYPLRVTGTSTGRAPRGHGDLVNLALPWVDAAKPSRGSASLPRAGALCPLSWGWGGSMSARGLGEQGSHQEQLQHPTGHPWSLGDYLCAAHGCWGDRSPVSPSPAAALLHRAEVVSSSGSCLQQLVVGVLPPTHCPCVSQHCSCPACPWGCSLKVSAGGGGGHGSGRTGGLRVGGP